jgi:hypothetical protein
MTRWSAPSAGTECVAADPIGSSATLPMRRSRRSIFTMSNSAVSSFPRPFRVRVLLLPVRSTRPQRGVGGAPGGSSLELVALVSARRHACEAWALPRNREAASRRSTVALSAQGPLPLPALPPAPARRLHATGRVCPAAAPRRFVSTVYEPRSTPLPAPPSGLSPETPLMSEDDTDVAWMLLVVNYYV